MNRELRVLVMSGKPAIVYAPLRHALSSGGKRLRALLVLLASNAVGGNDAVALPAAVAVECLHNFTLIHDDVMDRSPVRRGRPTVHAKWNDAVAVLAGDQLMALGYESLLGGEGRRVQAGKGKPRAGAARILSVYTRAYRHVCEGQGYDLEFEGRRAVTMREYRRMIELKTARVIAAAAEIGALAGGGSPEEVRALRGYGERLGLAFQIRDDVLDVTGVQKEFGKKIGGDIARGKKTYLLVKAMETARGRDAALLRRVAMGRGARLVGQVRSVYERTGAVDAAAREIGKLTRTAKSGLRSFPGSAGKAILLDFADRLADRTA
ncbi:MAG TPA: polyprenyl synthetase family protein [Bacteroidota bacterium]|nr:polyprenyl synthetase family protein [Bacteroidota bacterium]